jgi:glycosyltransferase involved in cell wall biosynthesis
MATPFVSVLIDTYNHERFIEQAVLSVLEQDFPRSDREVIVVDDGSTDRTPEILGKFEPQIRIIRKRNGGQASAFNAGIPECRGKIVAFLDGDDWWAPNKLRRVTECMNGDRSVGLIGHGITIVHRDGREQTEMLREGFRFRADNISGVRLLQSRGAFLGTSRLAVRADLLERVGPVPEEIRIQADEFLSTVASLIADVCILPEALTFYRLHEDNRFQLAKSDLNKIQQKQRSLAMLARALSHRLEALGAMREVRRSIVELAQANADQLRFAIYGGRPWHTFKAEWTIYRASHPDARISHRTFKLLTLLGAFIITSRGYYNLQRAMADSAVYRRIRERWFPAPQMRHIEKIWHGP